MIFVAAAPTTRDVPEESLMLTGDENIVDVDFSVLWKVKPTGVGDYLFNIQNPEGTVKAVAESAMREVVGRSEIQPILTGARQTIENAVQELMQRTLDHYGAGILVQQVQLQKVDPPSQVIDAFRDVQAARADLERAINEAQTYANRVVPEARGRVAQITQAAEAYKQQTVAEATGQTARFLKIFERIQEGTRRHARTHVSRNNGAHTRRYRKDHPGFRRRRRKQRRALPAAQRAYASGPAAQPVAERRPAMRTNFVGGIFAVMVVAALIVGYSSLFTVYQTQQALVVRLGEPVRQIPDQAFNVKAPFIDSVVYIDKRILDLEAPPQEVIASDQKRLVVDAFARYRIKDPLRFYQTLGSINGANSQLSILLNSALRRVLGEVTFTHVVRDQRADLMARIRELVDHEATAFGIEVVDIRIRRADLPEQNSQAVYQRMQTERQREAAEFRAQGAQRAQEIRSRADREVTVLVADATSKSEQIRGEGDATRNQIFADAFNQDPDFFAFYRSMQAYEQGFKHNDTRMLLKPDSNFFRYFTDPSGKPRENSGTPAPSAPAR